MHTLLPLRMHNIFPLKPCILAVNGRQIRNPSLILPLPPQHHQPYLRHHSSNPYRTKPSGFERSYSAISIHGYSSIHFSRKSTTSKGNMQPPNRALLHIPLRHYNNTRNATIRKKSLLFKLPYNSLHRAVNRKSVEPAQPRGGTQC